MIQAFRAMGLALAFAASPAHSAADGAVDRFIEALRDGRRSATLDWDNDTWLFSDQTDRFYTNGTRLVFRFAERDARSESRDADGMQSLRRGVYGFRFGQNMYTPSDIRLTPAQIQPGDRPYAGWLHFGVFREQFSTKGNGGHYTRLGVDIGCIGPCAQAEAAQKAVHKLVEASEPQGWSQQIRSEVGLQFSFDYSPLRWLPTSWIELTPFMRSNVGNIFLDASAAVQGRIGWFESPYVGSVDSRVPGSFAGAVTDAMRRRHAYQLFAFGRVEARAVGYNATLQGGLFNRSRNTVTSEPIVYDTEFGVALVSRRWSASYSVATRSNEPANLPVSISKHQWGRITISYELD